jgi:hypothetical protein
MTFNFEKWRGNPKKSRSYSGGHVPYVRFTVSKNLYISTAVFSGESSDDVDFDLMIDGANRVFALKFCNCGQFRVTTVPATIGGMATFIGEFHPKIDERLLVKHDATSGLWVGHLDGGRGGYVTG